ILDFANLVALRDGSGSEYITLLLVESIVLPNSMWLFAVRYRHVVKRYFAKITRQPNLLDDRYCAMQMFQKRCTLMGSMYRGHRARSLASTYYDSSTVDRRQQNSQGRQSRNGRLAKIQDVGHVTMGLGRGGELNHGYSPTHHPLDSSSAASSFNNDPLTHSTGSTGTEWDAVQLHQLHQQPVSSGEQVRAVVHPLGTLPEQRKEEEAAAKDAAKEADDEENRIDAVIVCTTEMAAEDSPTAVPT
uniref:G_PROTEIN_RECEP_F1_2 domain-containing protein n=1 Tax=Macrostomum lignano TaxID=282301 RepID=A0A1I8GKV3_9PLAT